MPRIRLIHWKASEAEEKAGQLQELGYQVDSKLLDAAGLKRLKENPPIAVVIDLSRMPSQGRDLGVWLRKQKSTRLVPLVFVAGEPEKVQRVKQLLPDAVYTTWDEIASTLEHALSERPSDPVVPASVFEAYKDKPLTEKLGIKPDSVLAVIDAPEDFERTLGKLPNNVTLRRDAEKGCDLAVWFVTSREELTSRIQSLASLADKDGLWIAWPKKSSGVSSDLSQVAVRKVAEAAGLVDYKISAIDQTWSGLRFTFKKRTK